MHNEADFIFSFKLAKRKHNFLIIYGISKWFWNAMDSLISLISKDKRYNYLHIMRWDSDEIF